MTSENQSSHINNDDEEWVVVKPAPPNRRWCPTHRVWEINPPGRLLCGPAWAELYKMEDEEEEGQMATIQVLNKIVEKIDDLVYVIDRRRSVVAEPPTKPQRPLPPSTPPPSRTNGRGGVAGL